MRVPANVSGQVGIGNCGFDDRDWLNCWNLALDERLKTISGSKSIRCTSSCICKYKCTVQLCTPFPTFILWFASPYWKSRSWYLPIWRLLGWAGPEPRCWATTYLAAEECRSCRTGASASDSRSRSVCPFFQPRRCSELRVSYSFARHLWLYCKFFVWLESARPLGFRGQAIQATGTARRFWSLSRRFSSAWMCAFKSNCPHLLAAPLLHWCPHKSQSVPSISASIDRTEPGRFLWACTTLRLCPLKTATPFSRNWQKR